MGGKSNNSGVIWPQVKVKVTAFCKLLLSIVLLLFSKHFGNCFPSVRNTFSAPSLAANAPGRANPAPNWKIQLQLFGTEYSNNSPQVYICVPLYSRWSQYTGLKRPTMAKHTFRNRHAIPLTIWRNVNCFNTAITNQTAWQFWTNR